MPIKRMRAGKIGNVSAMVDPEQLAAMAMGVWLTPRTPETVNSSFRPTQKSQSGEFSGVSQTNRPLPKFNAAKLKNRFRESLYIGVRSPYALVNLIRESKGEEIYHWDRMSAARCNATLVKHLNMSVKGEDLRYTQLFDPKFGSQLFARTITQILKQIQMGVPPGAANHGIHTGAVTKPCRDAKKWMEPNAAIPWIYNPSLVTDPNPTFDAPRQGAADDCWFIAALSSIAWVFPDLLKYTNNDGIFILDLSSPLTGQELLDASFVYPDNTLPYSLTGTPDSPLYWWSRSKNAERWVAMMEKAFAVQYLHTGAANPNVCNLPLGDPQYSLYVLTGDLNYQRFWNISQTGGATSWQNENGTVTYTTDTLWTEVKNSCTSYAGKAFLKISKPAVTFTFNSSGDAPLPANSSSLEPYSTDLLVASHSYSLLGLFTEEEVRYVVLRNPWGIINGVTYKDRTCIPGSGGSLAKGPLTGFYNGTTNRKLWTGIYDAATHQYPDTSLLLDGVFALDFETFARYFHGFSWV